MRSRCKNALASLVLLAFHAPVKPLRPRFRACAKSSNPFPAGFVAQRVSPANKLAGWAVGPNFLPHET